MKYIKLDSIWVQKTIIHYNPLPNYLITCTMELILYIQIYTNALLNFMNFK